MLRHERCDKYIPIQCIPKILEHFLNRRFLGCNFKNIFLCKNFCRYFVNELLKSRKSHEQSIRTNLGNVHLFIYYSSPYNFRYNFFTDKKKYLFDTFSSR